MDNQVKNKIEKIRKIIDEKVVGAWIPCHDETGHHYRHRDSGVIVDSTTTKDVVNKPHLLPWAARIAAQYIIDRIDLYCPENKDQFLKEASWAFTAERDNAGSIGTRAHDCNESYIKKWLETGVRPENIKSFIPENEDGKVFAACRSMERMFIEHPQWIPVATELVVGSIKHKGAGTLDLIVYDIEEKCLILLDHKTSNQMNDISYPMQLSAYRRYFMEMTDLKVKKVYVEHLSKDYNKVDLYLIINHQTAFKMHKHSVALYDWTKLDKNERAIKEVKTINI